MNKRSKNRGDAAKEKISSKMSAGLKILVLQLMKKMRVNSHNSTKSMSKTNRRPLTYTAQEKTKAHNRKSEYLPEYNESHISILKHSNNSD